MSQQALQVTAAGGRSGNPNNGTTNGFRAEVVDFIKANRC